MYLNSKEKTQNYSISTPERKDKQLHLIKKGTFKDGIKAWIKENKKLAISSSLSLLVLSTSITLLNSPEVEIKDFEKKGVTIFSQEEGEQNSRMHSLVNQFYNDSELEPIDASDSIFEEGDIKKNVLLSFPGSSLIENHFLEESLDNLLIDYLERQKELEELERKRLQEQHIQEAKEYISFYTSIYGLDYEKVYQILSNLTDGFQSEAYLNQYIIGESTLKGRNVTCTSREMAILIAVRNIYYNAKAYGYLYDDLKNGEIFEPNLDYSHQIGYFSHLLGIEPALNWAICNTECGFNSVMFLERHNPAGIKFPHSGFASFPSFTAGFIEETLELLKYKIDGRTTIESIGNRYAPIYYDENGNAINGDWIPDVTKEYNYATANYDTLFGTFDNIAIFRNSENNSLEEEERIIQLYCDIYGLDYEKVYQILNSLTDNFTDINYQYYYRIGTSKLDNVPIKCENKEMAILIAIYNIYLHPNEYGYSKEEISGTRTFISNLSPTNQLEYLSNVLGIDSALNYAIFYASYNSQENQYFTKVDERIHMVSPDSTMALIEQSLELLKREQAKKNSLNPFIYNRNIPNSSTWTSDVISIYHYTSKNYDKIFQTSTDTTLQNRKIYTLQS